MLDIILSQALLGIVLFFIINWIGKHSYSVGYMEISMFLKVEEAPAFNFLFRVLSPIVYLFITAAILYSVGLDRYVQDYFMVSVYYLVFRLGFNLATNRGLLLNWTRQVLYWVLISTISYYSYVKIIANKESILPDFSTIANELWIIILVFLFQIANGIRFSSKHTVERKMNYLKSRYQYFNKRYAHIVDSRTSNDKLKGIIYAIMIYEDFNRPKIIRLIENISFVVLRKPHSLGVMQVKSTRFINDRDSVELGIAKILNAYSAAIKSKDLDSEETVNRLLPDAWVQEQSLERLIIKDYNPDDRYISEVRELAERIFDDIMKPPKRYLFPHYSE